MSQAEPCTPCTTASQVFVACRDHDTASGCARNGGLSRTVGAAPQVAFASASAAR